MLSSVHNSTSSPVYRLASCIALEHDPVLLGVALLVCLIGTLVVARLLRRAMRSTGGARVAWISIGALVAGSTTWCTHFVAMLAYRPDIPVGYDPTATVISLVVAVVGTVAAFGLGSEKGPLAPTLGGVAFGVAVGTMHYTGMAAIAAGAIFRIDGGYVALSVLGAVLFGIAAFRQAARREGKAVFVAVAALLALSILSLHLLGMASVEIEPLAVGSSLTVDDVTRGPLALAVAGVGLLILATGAVTYVLDSQAAARADARLRHLAESAVDGMALCRDGAIVEVNAALEAMTGLPRDAIVGRPMAQFVEPSDVPECQLVGASLRVADGGTLPVELAVRTEAGGAADCALTVYALRDISERLSQQRQIEVLARFDELTGLRNRAAFLREAEVRLDRSGSGAVAILVIDVNRLKDINDGFGHAAGDAVLVELARRLGLLVGPSHITARLGSDEFAVLGPVRTHDDAMTLAEEIVALAAGPVVVEGCRLHPSVCVGIAFAPNHGTEINALLNNADLALRRAKSDEGSRVCPYDPSMDDAVRAQRALADELRRAIADGQLTVAYQLQVRIADEEPVGFEALVRWRHPTRGFVSPAEFIPLAERAGLVGKLGTFVMRTACREAAAWRDELSVSVNVSPLQLNDPDFVSTVVATLAETGIAPQRVEFEVTEHSFIIDQTRAKGVLEQLRALGIAIAIDDFGVGYSSIAMLQAFPFDKIKLDKLFIDKIGTDKKAAGILHAVLSLGRALDVSVVAEGVETPAQLEHLRAEGCPLVQGYIYGRPETTLDRRYYRADRQTAAA